MDEFYTVKELALIFKVQPRTINRMIESKRLKGIKIGCGTGRRSEWRVLKKDLDRFIPEEYDRQN